MRMLRFFILLVTVLGGLGLRQGNSQTANGKFLPPAFGGWQLSQPSEISKNPAVADPTNARLLAEYGFTDFEGATYTREDGRKLTIKAARFQDASGAYGAFTFYKTPEMLNEKIGDQGYSLNERVLFYRGNILVDAVFQKLSAMSAAELRELAELLPRPQGAIANLPGLPTYLPKTSYVRNTARYIVGPVALEKTGAPLTADYVDFSRGAEVVLGDYNVSGNPARLMLISYPTPQIAASQLTKIETARQAHQLGDVQLSVRRTGPILVLASGALSPDDSRFLLSSVNYDADVIWNENTHFTRRDNVANLIVGVILLAAIIGGMSIVAGIAFGGFRLAIKRFFPDKVFDRPEQMEIIALHLSDPGRRPQDST
ncbi:MAG: hypothetical protein JOZ14_09950 [Acidobacteria bacterium]|nr:hypothetical protein [Acidobacteriota bacterium]